MQKIRPVLGALAASIALHAQPAKGQANGAEAGPESNADLRIFLVDPAIRYRVPPSPERIQEASDVSIAVSGSAMTQAVLRLLRGVTEGLDCRRGDFRAVVVFREHDTGLERWAVAPAGYILDMTRRKCKKVPKKNLAPFFALFDLLEIPGHATGP